MQNRIFFTVIALYFVVSAIAHFTRLALGLDVMIGDYELPTIVSGICVIFSVFIVYWSLRMIKRGKEIRGESEGERDRYHGDDKENDKHEDVI